MQLKWYGKEIQEEVVQTRLHCYSGSPTDRERFVKHIQSDPRPGKKDFLLARDGGETVGTITNMNLTMRLRGADLPCQGIAWVGTIKTQRRNAKTKGQGIASQLMFEALRKARDEGQALTALMPFRASFYEHFGYGQAEQRMEWTIPSSLLPVGDISGFRFWKDSDFGALVKLRHREYETGQADVLTDKATLKFWLDYHSNGWRFVDVAHDGSLRGFAYVADEMNGAIRNARVDDWCCASPGDFHRILRFLGTLRDQYCNAIITTPIDWPINLLLRESQIPHRPVAHTTASCQPQTRMQMRVLDHKKTLDAMKLPELASGAIDLTIHECEGTQSKVHLEFSSGRCSVKPSKTTAEFECADKIWSSIIAGEMRATDAIRWGLASGDMASASILDCFSHGKRGFCQDYF